jgi:hypothetical protein
LAGLIAVFYQAVSLPTPKKPMRRQTLFELSDDVVNHRAGVFKELAGRMSDGDFKSFFHLGLRRKDAWFDQAGDISVSGSDNVENQKRSFKFELVKSGPNGFSRFFASFELILDGFARFC